MRRGIILPHGAIAGTVLLLGILLLVGCGEGKNSVVTSEGTLPTPRAQEESSKGMAPTEPKQIRIVATTNILRDWIENVGGDRVEVHSVVPSGADPHTFRLTPKEMGGMEGSHLGFFVGEHYEENWLDSLTHVLLEGDARLIHLSEYVELRPYSSDGFNKKGADVTDSGDHEEDQHENSGEYDPHFWHDPITVIDAINRIAIELSEVSPNEKSYFESNAESYMEKLTQLDLWVMDQVGEIPREKKIMITNHETMGYFAERYDFTLEDSIIPGLSSGASVSPRQLANIIDQIKGTGVKAVFGEPNMSHKIMNAISEDTGVSVVYLHSESFGARGEVSNYIGMIRSNVNGIVEGLAE